MAFTGEEKSSQNPTIATPSTDNSPQQKQEFNAWQLWNMSIGFLGIQFGWGLQMANMSSIFEHLGASAHSIPILWLAAPLTGLLVQPIIGNLSDYTWTPLGRRRPYILVGAILASMALVLMPQCGSLWMAAGLLWILDTSANTSMVPFRAFVGDLLPQQQRTKGFAMQSVMVGLGAIAASMLPWLLSHLFAVNSTTGPDQQIPQSVTWSFYIGAGLFLTTVLWTVLTTSESPPPDLDRFDQLKEKRGGIRQSFSETWQVLGQMPPTMYRLAWVQIFTWLGIFCFFIYFPPAVARNIFGAVDIQSTLYNQGIEWAGLCFAVFNAVCIPFSFLLPWLTRRLGRKVIHIICLLCGGFSLIALLKIQQPWLLLPSMVGFGLAWASAQAIPYAILTYALPTQRRGIYQGIFNFFIVLPEIAVSLGFGWIMEHWLQDNRLTAVVLGGSFLVIAAALMLFVPTEAKQLAGLKTSPQQMAEPSVVDSTV
ncbi:MULTISPECIES: MFS transporter [Cyanophyceae]|uniref:MFS transporter n=1 Tax=Cyanophyceae TaxID=3028117 RepID=UPI00016DC850|nr:MULTISPECIES: MFS transporter [Cyanophyceae]ACA98848.1 probable Transport protein, Major Facilitator Superfamily protein [Picosynechococcus sp. PCC 7002]SMH37855.1 maltose/moltooligosaccharide transporter [Picosynechococcus sp. OG1]SMQ77934.1 maltose/moltooligosaccharide transporter [Synechococcus sp. 7002]